MNTDVLQNALGTLTQKLAQAELTNALLQAELALLQEGKNNAKTDDAN